MLINKNIFFCFQIHSKYKLSSRHKRNLAITGGVVTSVLVAPVVAGLAVGLYFCIFFSDQKQVPSSEGASSSKGQGFKFKVEVPDELPFQLQIKYKDTEGATALRVLKQTRPVTRERKQAEQSK